MFSLFTKDEGFSFGGGLALMEPLEGRRLLSAAGQDNPHFAPQPDDYGGKVFWNGTETVFPQDHNYDCHDYAWLGGDPVILRPDDNDIPYLNPPHSNPVEPGQAQPGDIVVYGSDKNGDGVFSGKDEIMHSGVVTAVDENGLILEIDGKEGSGPISTHHPADAIPFYGDPIGVFRPTNPPEVRPDKGDDPVHWIDWLKDFHDKHNIPYEPWLADAIAEREKELKEEVDEEAEIMVPLWIENYSDVYVAIFANGNRFSFAPEVGGTYAV